jgi:hypothetical protein
MDLQLEVLGMEVLERRSWERKMKGAAKDLASRIVLIDFAVALLL